MFPRHRHMAPVPRADRRADADSSSCWLVSSAGRVGQNGLQREAIFLTSEPEIKRSQTPQISVAVEMNSRLCAARLGLEEWGGSDPHSSPAHIAGSIPLSGWMSNFEQLWQPDLWILNGDTRFYFRQGNPKTGP
jgi:hypothetical protein